jgi:hypothetical protein
MRRLGLALATLALAATPASAAGTHLHKPASTDDQMHVYADASTPRGASAVLTLTGPNGERVTETADKGGHLHVATPCDPTDAGKWTAYLTTRSGTLSKSSILTCV